jgi:proton-translocating NADH-quinone oxidoreductase chain M
MNYVLFSVIVLPFLGFLCVMALPLKNLVKEVSFAFSILTFYTSLFLWIFFDNSAASFQFITDFYWINTCNYQIRFGIDGISLFFIILTTFLIPLCFLFFWDQNTKNQQDIKYYYGAFLLIEAFILIVFSTLDLVVFYVFFESVLIPIFYIVGVWGTRDRKVRAGYLLFLYTLFGSLFILLGIILIYIETGTTDYLVLLENEFSFNKQKLLWLAFFFSFATKVPIIPAHIWLPEAHVEAPTGGSVILAGILLKLGTYGFLRFSLPLFPLASVYFRPLIFVISSIAVIYTSITALRQTDIKRVIAYASVAHMNITIAGVFSFSFTGLEGSILQMLSHGVVSGALFSVLEYFMIDIIVDLLNIFPV